MTVNLSKLKVGDTVITRDGESIEIDMIRFHSSGIYPFEIRLGGDVKRLETYTVYGHVFSAQTPYKNDIVKIIPKESEMIKRNINGVEIEVHGSDDVRVVSQDKPKRFVDLLAEGEGFIKDFKGYIWRYNQDTFRMELWNSNHNVFTSLEGFDDNVLFHQATSAHNPERNKKVVYHVLYKSSSGNYTVSGLKYESKEAWDKEYPDSVFMQFIEESREEVEG